MHTNTPTQGVPIQSMLPFAEASMRDAVQATLKRVRRPDKPRETSRAMTLISFQQLELDLPLFDVASVMVDATYEVVEPAARSEPIAYEDVPGHFKDLTLEHVAQIHARMLYRQLEQLFYARNVDSATRREILEWIYEPSEILHVRADGVAKTLLSVHIPFTFDACCSFEQIDAEHLRDAITRRIEELKGSRKLLSNSKLQELQ